MIIDELNLLQKLVRCKSITPENDGILELCKHTLQNLGFEVEILVFNDQESYPVSNIYAKLGNGSNSLGFCGHLDVVPPGIDQNWSSPPFAANIINDAIIGRGTEDMKGSIACFITAISNIISSFNKNKNSLIIMLTLDEEKLAINGINKLIKYIVVNKKLELQGCLLGEPTCENYVGDCIKIGRRGSLNFNISVSGKQGHVAYPELFSNPVKVINCIVTELLKIDLSKPVNNFEPSNLEITGINSSSSVYNMIPEEITIKGNIRYNTAYSLNELQNILINIINKYKNTTIDFLADSSTPFIINTNSKIYLNLKDAIIEVTKKLPKNNTFGGTSDARYLKEYTQVVEFGLLEKTLHQNNEQVMISDLHKLTKIYTKFLINFFNIN